MKQKEIDSAVVSMQIFLSGLTSTFDVDFQEPEKIIKRTLLEVDFGASR